MERISVYSKSIRSIGYDCDERILEVEFRPGSIYQYYDVPPKVHQWFMRVSSKTAYLERNIKGCYEYVRLGSHNSREQDEAELLALLQASIKNPEPEEETEDS